MTICHIINLFSKTPLQYHKDKKGFMMIEMASVLGGSFILMLIAYEFTFLPRRKWGENKRSFF